MNNMEKREFMRMIARITGKKFVEYRNGYVDDIFTGEVIPIEHIACHEYPREEGYYMASPATCSDGNGCEIGKPLKACYCGPRKCAVYFLRKPEGKMIIDVGLLMGELVNG